MILCCRLMSDVRGTHSTIGMYFGIFAAISYSLCVFLFFVGGNRGRFHQASMRESSGALAAAFSDVHLLFCENFLSTFISRAPVICACSLTVAGCIVQYSAHSNCIAQTYVRVCVCVL